MSVTDPPWRISRATWLEDVERWLADVLRARDESAALIESVRERPWGAVLRVRTERDVRYFKAVGPRGSHEPEVLADVAAHSSHLAPDVLAVDAGRGWILMGDHGRPMRDAIDPHAQVAAVESFLPSLAAMQQATVDHVDRWLAIGVPDRRVRVLPAQVADLLAGDSQLGPLPIDEDVRRAYEDVLPLLADVCDDLASTPVADALDHADIHGTNVLVDAAGAARLVDWGDSCITHPWSTVFVPLGWVVALLPPTDRPSAARRLRDAYLEGWGGYADHRSFAQATWIAYVTRAVMNDHQCAGGDPADIADARREILDLLHRWWAKASLLGEPDELLVT